MDDELPTPSDVVRFYSSDVELDRLERGLGALEFERTKELIARFVQPGSAVADVGGAAGQLAERAGRDRSVIARWEQGVVAPSVETLIELVRACGFDLPLELVSHDVTGADRLKKNTMLTPERRVHRLITAVERGEGRG